MDLIRSLFNFSVPEPEETSVWDEAENDDNHPWMLTLALHAAKGLLKRPRLTPDESEAIAEALARTPAGVQVDRFHGIEELAKCSEKFSDLRSKFFKLAAQRIAKPDSEREVPLHSVHILYNSFAPVESDFNWLLEDIRRAASDSERRVVTRWAIELWESLRRPHGILKQLHTACRPFPESRKILWKSLHPGIRARFIRWKYRYFGYVSWRFKLRVFLRDMEQRYHHWRDRWNLFRYRKKLESGEYIRWLANLLPHSSSTYIAEDWSELHKEYGDACALAVRAGCKRKWREYQPPLPYERLGESSITIRVGMAGIFAGWKDGEITFPELSDADADRAARYALYELNGFASWFAELAKDRPAVVRSVLEQCIRAEWEIDAIPNECRLTVYKLSAYGEDVRDLTRDCILQLLSDRDPKNEQIRDYAVKTLILDVTIPTDIFAKLAELRVKQYSIGESGFRLWSAVWLQSDAVPAVEHLIQVLTEYDSSKAAMVAICYILSGQAHGYPLLGSRSWASPKVMRIFVPMVYRYIRFGDDQNLPDGQARFLNSRDDAQSFRNSLLTFLADTNEAEAGDVLRELMNEPLLATYRDYIHHLIEKHSQQFADLPKWRARDVRAFATTFQREPQTDTDLFRLGVRRLENIKAWVETGEDSPRADVRPELKETGVRRWLARQLVKQNEPKIIVPEEWEIDAAKRPDLRLAVPGIAPVSIELKVADEWSLNELLERLENQLVGQYLRDHRSRYGIYALALFNKERTWKDTSGNLVDAHCMVSMLQARAAQIVSTRPDIHQVKVISVCFSK